MVAGDIGAKFAWDTKALGRHFEMSPASGFLTPGQVTKLQVTLAPIAASPDLRADDVTCTIDGLRQPLAVTLSGAAIADTAVSGTLEFDCAVREKATQSLTLSNPTAVKWQLKPVVQNAFWTGAEFFNVPAGGSAEYKVEFRPLTMAATDAPHSGTLFFPIPDGSGKLFRLLGTATKPAPVAVIKRCVPPIGICAFVATRQLVPPLA